MCYKQKFTKGRIICFILSCLLSLLICSFGVILLLRGNIININFLITFLILPLAYSAGCYFLIFSNLKNCIKVIIFAVHLCLTLCITLFTFLFGPHERIQHHIGNEALTSYAEESLHEQIFPVMPEIGEPLHVEFHEYDSLFVIFSAEAETLICQYSEEDYWKQKSSLEDIFYFRTKPVTACGVTCSHATEIDGYHFRMVIDAKEAEWEAYFPKRIAFVATNDITHEVVYIAYRDQDLDYIDSLNDFILKECGWEHIR